MFSKQNRSSKTKGNANLKVVVRLRPPNDDEDSEKYRTVTHAISDHMLVFDPKVQALPGVVQAKPRSMTSHRFKDLKYAFDHVFGAGATNREVFEHATKGVVSGVLSGYNCSVFAYGATGAGKTHTMLGNEREPGVIYLTMMDLYRQIEEQKQEKVFDVAISYSEVYNEQVRDLLVPRGSLPIREDKTVGVIIAGLSLHKPKTAEELLHMLHFGNKNRTQHPTDANAESSRSHAVFQVFVNQRNKLASLGSEMVMAKMCLVDLAGSERAHCTTNCGARFREGANINRSLLALGNVINALADNKFKGHIPYRDSKLTRLLKDSLGGNCRTVMIAAVSPSSRSFEDTYNTLRYADRAKHIRADVKKNVMNVDFHITNYKKYVQDLEKQNQELRKTKQQLLECLENTESGGLNGLNPALSPIMRQLQERLKDLFKVRRDMCKKQMDSEGAKRELKWKVSRREQAIKRVQQLTGTSTVLSKHSNVIDRMRRRIEKEEQSLQHSTRQIHEQDDLIRKTVAEFTVVDGRQAPEMFDASVKSHIVESNLYESEMYLAFVKKLARAQERQAGVTESLVTNLLQLVKRQHDILHSQDLLSPELQLKYEQCCYLVEERGVTFSQQSVPTPLHGAGGGECGGDAKPSPSSAVAAASTALATGAAADCFNISDIIDIRIPRLRAHELLQRGTEVKPQAPRRVLMPGSAVQPAARLNSSEDVESRNSPIPSMPLPSHQASVTQTSTSDASANPSVSTVAANQNPIDQLHCHLQACPTQRERNLSIHSKDKHESPQVTSSAFLLGEKANDSQSTHHQFATVFRTSHQRQVLASPPSLHQPASRQESPVSVDANSSTDHLSNTFQVLQPTLPNTPCIDISPRQPHTPQCLTPTTPRGKRLGSGHFQHRLSFLEAPAIGKTLQPQSGLGQGDGRGAGRPQASQQISVTRLNANNGNSNANVKPPARIPSATPHKPPQRVIDRTPGQLQRSTDSTRQDPQVISSSPKSYAEVLKSPPVRVLSVKTPGSSKPPARVRVEEPGPNKPSDTTSTVSTPNFNLSLFKRRLQLSCEKLPVRVEMAKSAERSDSGAARQPLQALNPNNKQVADTKTVSSTGLSTTTSLPSSKTSKPETSLAQSKSHCYSSQTSLKMKAPLPQRFRRALGVTKPYNTQSPRRQRRWRGAVEALGEAPNMALSGRPSYMQPTFARAQKMLGQDTDKSSQRQTDNPVAPTRRTILHKQRFVLA